jgi:hypothetical protein
VTISPLSHVPVACGPAYYERIQRLPSKFIVTLVPEPGNRFNLTAVAVLTGTERIGYLPADLSRRYFEALQTAPGGAGCECPRAPVSCSVRQHGRPTSC